MNESRKTVEMLRKQHYRYGGLVSKGGSYMVAWMEKNNKENPQPENPPELLFTPDEHANCEQQQ